MACLVRKGKTGKGFGNAKESACGVDDAAEPRHGFVCGGEKSCNIIIAGHIAPGTDVSEVGVGHSEVGVSHRTFTGRE